MRCCTPQTGPRFQVGLGSIYLVALSSPFARSAVLLLCNYLCSPSAPSLQHDCPDSSNHRRRQCTEPTPAVAKMNTDSNGSGGKTSGNRGADEQHEGATLSPPQQQDDDVAEPRSSPHASRTLLLPDLFFLFARHPVLHECARQIARRVSGFLLPDPVTTAGTAAAAAGGASAPPADGGGSASAAAVAEFPPPLKPRPVAHGRSRALPGTNIVADLAARLQAAENKTHTEQKRNIFSKEYDEDYTQATSLKKGDKGYGHPPEGSLSEARGQRAKRWVKQQMDMLLGVIAREGKPDKTRDGRTGIDFGSLFCIYQDISNTLVGMIRRSRKAKLLDFEGDMLYQHSHDDVMITLSKKGTHRVDEFNLRELELRRME